MVETLTGLDARALREAVEREAYRFEPLRGRLTLVATTSINGPTIRYVDDGLATSVLPTVAALEVFVDEPVALIAGGFDRGVDYDELADALAARLQPTTLIAMGDAGQRLATALALRSDVAQRRILEAIAGHAKVAIRSGQKTGKSTSFVAAALWWVATRKRGMVGL